MIEKICGMCKFEGNCKEKQQGSSDQEFTHCLIYLLNENDSKILFEHRW